MVLHDLHRAIHPAIALPHEGVECIGHHTLAHALGDISCAITGFEEFQAEFGIFRDAPFGPTADFSKRVLAHDRHGAMLNDGVVFIALDHADLEEAAILLIGHGLEYVLLRVAIVLWTLNKRDLR